MVIHNLGFFITRTLNYDEVVYACSKNNIVLIMNYVDGNNLDVLIFQKKIVQKVSIYSGKKNIPLSTSLSSYCPWGRKCNRVYAQVKSSSDSSRH